MCGRETLECRRSGEEGKEENCWLEREFLPLKAGMGSEEGCEEEVGEFGGEEDELREGAWDWWMERDGFLVES